VARGRAAVRGKEKPLQLESWPEWHLFIGQRRTHGVETLHWEMIAKLGQVQSFPPLSALSRPYVHTFAKASLIPTGLRTELALEPSSSIPQLLAMPILTTHNDLHAGFC